MALRWRSARALAVLFGVCAGGLSLPCSGVAAPVVVGSPLTAAFAELGESEPPYTFVNQILPEPGAEALSPVSGTVVRWSAIGTIRPPGFVLTVLRPQPGTSYLAVAASAPQIAPTPGRHSFAVDLPIQAGDAIGLTTSAGSTIGSILPLAGATAAATQLGIAPGETQSFTSFPEIEYGFDAEVQAQPRITSISPTSGPIKGGEAVTITGTELEGASAVSFSGAPASFTVDSESRITAIAPPFQVRGNAPISVTTVAGTATGSPFFAYRGCIVPRAKGVKLKSAKKRIRADECQVGKIKKRKHVTAATGRVVRQVPPPGTIPAPGTKIKLTLG